MRTRALVAIVMIMLPGVLAAQRIRPPRMGGPDGPTGAAPLPPQPAAIARELAYKRLRLSVESYPLVSYIQAPGFAVNSPISSWTTFGMGTRFDYRVSRFLSTTLDLTSSFLGGPANTQTVELGTRLHPQRSERRLYPFVDLRFGYVQSVNTHFWPNDIYGNPTTYSVAQSTRFSQGMGGVGGAGFELALTRSFSLTSAASVMRGHLSAYGNGVSATPRNGHNYWMTAYRYTIGLRYNPVRLIRPPGTDFPSQ